MRDQNEEGGTSTPGKRPGCSEHVYMEVVPQIVFDQHETEIYNQELVPLNHLKVFDRKTHLRGSL